MRLNQTIHIKHFSIFIFVFLYTLLIPLISYGAELIKAVKSGDVTELRRLIRAGADVEEKTGGGLTPLWVASSGGHVDIVECVDYLKGQCQRGKPRWDPATMDFRRCWPH